MLYRCSFVTKRKGCNAPYGIFSMPISAPSETAARFAFIRWALSKRSDMPDNTYRILNIKPVLLNVQRQIDKSKRQHVPRLIEDALVKIKQAYDTGLISKSERNELIVVCQDVVTNTRWLKTMLRRRCHIGQKCLP